MIFECLFCFFYGTLSENDLAVPTCWPDQTKPQNPVLFHMELCCGPCYLINPNRIHSNKPNFWGSESGNLENSSFTMHWPYAFVIVCRQPQCFDALLIFKRMLMSENWLKQDVQNLQFMHRICGTFCVRRYQQFCTLMVNGNAYNQNSLIAVTHWVEKTDLIRSVVWSYSTVHAEKVRLALATPLW